LILMRIIKTVATRCQILRLTCTKFDFAWGCTPDSAGGAYSAPPGPQAAFKELTSRGSDRGQGKGRGGEGRKGEAKGGKGWEDPPALLIPPPGCRGARIVSVADIRRCIRYRSAVSTSPFTTARLQHTLTLSSPVVSNGYTSK